MPVEDPTTPLEQLFFPVCLFHLFHLFLSLLRLLLIFLHHMHRALRSQGSSDEVHLIRSPQAAGVCMFFGEGSV